MSGSRGVEEKGAVSVRGVEEKGAMSTRGGEGAVVDQRRDQMLKLVAKGFFNELVNYGLRKEEIVRVASQLLGNLLEGRGRLGGVPHDASFTVDAVVDEWQAGRRLEVRGVELRPFDRELVPRVARWLATPEARENFVPAFPDTEARLHEHFARPDVEYLGVYWEGAPVGFVGGENVDAEAGKLEMKKLVGEAGLQGKGIGKRATFGFLYYAFAIRGMHKVYIHSRDINVRNIGLNSGFGFELEGVFLEDLRAGERRADVIRMALLRPLWAALFGAA